MKSPINWRKKRKNRGKGDAWKVWKLVYSFHPQIHVRASKTLTSGGLSNYGGVSRSGYRANAVGSGRRAVSESAPRVGGFAVRGKPPALEPLLSVVPPFIPLSFQHHLPLRFSSSDFLERDSPSTWLRARLRVVRRNLED